MIPKTNFNQVPAELARLDTPTLRKELAQALTVSAANLMRLATIWNELERRGEDLSDLRSGLAVYLPMIASGELDAELVVRFAGQPGILKRVAELTLEDQRHLLNGGTLPVVEELSTGFQVREVPLRLLTLKQIKQVIVDGKVSPPEVQRNLLNKKEPSLSKATRRVSPQRLAAALEDLANQHPQVRDLVNKLRQETGI